MPNEPRPHCPSLICQPLLVGLASLPVGNRKAKWNDAMTDPHSQAGIVERLRRENDIKLSFGKDFSDLLLDAADRIEELEKSLRKILNGTCSECGASEIARTALPST